MTLQKVISSSELVDNTMKTVRVSGKTIAVARVDGQVFAVDDSCTHEQCSLGTEGFLDGSSLICGCHGASYDITDGKMLSLPALHDLGTYLVTEKDGDVYIQV